LIKEKVYVIDSSGLIYGLIPQKKIYNIFTVPEVIDEIKNEENVKIILKNAIDNNIILIRQAKNKFLLKVTNLSKETGDINKLSDTDIKLLSLAIELSEKFNVFLLTDDYAIQNIAKKMNIKIKMIKEKGISKIINWEKYCPACFKQYNSNYLDSCIVCGTKLKIRPKKT
jgi:UPF0271 protein